MFNRYYRCGYKIFPKHLNHDSQKIFVLCHQQRHQKKSKIMETCFSIIIIINLRKRQKRLLSMSMMVIIRRFVVRMMITMNGAKGLIREVRHFDIFFVVQFAYYKDCQVCMKTEKASLKKISFISRRLLCFTIFQIYILHYGHEMLSN